MSNERGVGGQPCICKRSSVELAVCGGGEMGGVELGLSGDHHLVGIIKCVPPLLKIVACEPGGADRML